MGQRYVRLFENTFFTRFSKEKMEIRLMYNLGTDAKAIILH